MMLARGGVEAENMEETRMRSEDKKHKTYRISLESSRCINYCHAQQAWKAERRNEPNEKKTKSESEEFVRAFAATKIVPAPSPGGKENDGGRKRAGEEEDDEFK